MVIKMISRGKRLNTLVGILFIVLILIAPNVSATLHLVDAGEGFTHAQDTPPGLNCGAFDDSIVISSGDDIAFRAYYMAWDLSTSPSAGSHHFHQLIVKSPTEEKGDFFDEIVLPNQVKFGYIGVIFYDIQVDTDFEVQHECKVQDLDTQLIAKLESWSTIEVTVV